MRTAIALAMLAVASDIKRGTIIPVVGEFARANHCRCLKKDAPLCASNDDLTFLFSHGDVVYVECATGGRGAPYACWMECPAPTGEE